jgi:N-acetylglucosamine-6-phosphate deacetylase
MNIKATKGAFGVDFSSTKDDLVSGVAKVANGLLKHGVTAFCPTVITSHPDEYAKVVSSIIILLSDHSADKANRREYPRSSSAR